MFGVKILCNIHFNLNETLLIRHICMQSTQHIFNLVSIAVWKKTGQWTRFAWNRQFQESRTGTLFLLLLQIHKIWKIENRNLNSTLGISAFPIAPPTIKKWSYIFIQPVCCFLCIALTREIAHKNLSNFSSWKCMKLFHGWFL